MLFPVQTNVQTTMTWPQNSRLSKVFPKSYMLRRLFASFAQIHAPMHNIQRYSKAHPNGDNYGKDYKIRFNSYTNLHEASDASFGAFPSMDYPLTSANKQIAVEKAKEIMKLHTRSSLAEELAKEDSKKAWSEDSMELGKKAYETVESGTCSSAYVKEQRESNMRQIALAGYRIANILKSTMAKNPISSSIEGLLKASQ